MELEPWRDVESLKGWVAKEEECKVEGHWRLTGCGDKDRSVCGEMRGVEGR